MTPFEIEHGVRMVFEPGEFKLLGEAAIKRVNSTGGDRPVHYLERFLQERYEKSKKGEVDTGLSDKTGKVCLALIDLLGSYRRHLTTELAEAPTIEAELDVVAAQCATYALETELTIQHFAHWGVEQLMQDH